VGYSKSNWRSVKSARELRSGNWAHRLCNRSNRCRIHSLPLQDIRSLRGFCARINHPFGARPPPVLSTLLHYLLHGLTRIDSAAVLARGLTQDRIVAVSIVGLYKIFVHVEAFVHESIILLVPPPLAFTRYCHHQYCMVCGLKRGGRWGGRILRNGRAIVLQ